MKWFDYIFITCLTIGFGSGLDQHFAKMRKNQEKIIEQNEQIIELLKTNNNDKEIQFVR